MLALASTHVNVTFILLSKRAKSVVMTGVATLLKSPKTFCLYSFSSFSLLPFCFILLFCGGERILFHILVVIELVFLAARFDFVEIVVKIERIVTGHFDQASCDI